MSNNLQAPSAGGTLSRRCRRILGWAAALTVVWVGGCQSAGDPTSDAEGCIDGLRRVCNDEVSRDGTTATCRAGTQECINGTWGPCEGGHLEQVPLPTPGGSLLGARSLSGDPVDCGSPCDPFCRNWDEIGNLPAGGAGGFGPDWFWCDPGSPSCEIDLPPIPTVEHTCEHGLCESGEGLDPTCHPCVEQICTGWPALDCCNTSGEWTEDCKAKVYTACAGEALPPLGFCDYGVLSHTQVQFQPDNSPYDRTNLRGPLGVTGNFASEPGNGFLTVYATGNVEFRQRSYVLGDVIAGGTVTSQSDLEIHGNLFAHGNVQLEQGTHIYGSVVTTSGYVHSQNPSAVVDGTVVAPGGTNSNVVVLNPSLTPPTEPVMTVPTLPTLAVDMTGTAVCEAIGAAALDTCLPGTYASLEADGGGTIDLACAGADCSYDIAGEFDMAGPSGANTLRVYCNPNGDGECTSVYDMRMGGGIFFGNNFKTECPDCPDRTSKDPSCIAGKLCVLDVTRFKWYTNATTGVDGNPEAVLIGNNVTNWYGMILAPNLGSKFKSYDTFEGRALIWVGGLFYSEPDNKVDATGLESACREAYPEAEGISPTNCPLDDTKVGSVSPINEPCRSAADCQFNRHCDDVATEAACSHSKCAAGTALSANCDPCVKMICATAAGADCCNVDWTDGSGATPNCVGMVKTVCDAECGADTGTCNTNPIGYLDPGIPSGPDLAMGVPCDTMVTVCNHGPDSATGNLSIGFFPTDGGQIFTPTPDPTWQVGQCTVSVDIASEYCAGIDLTNTGTVTCTGIDPATDLTTDLALFANDLGTMAEWTRLDNWTVFRPGFTCAEVCHPSGCSGAPLPATPITYPPERYHAQCGDGQKPTWQTLSWHAAAPHPAVIDFEFRTGQTETELDAATFQPISVELNGTTEDCDWATNATLPECPVILPPPTDGSPPPPGEMTLDQVHEPWLDLQITIDPGGIAGATVTLEDWELTYTCKDYE